MGYSISKSNDVKIYADTLKSAKKFRDISEQLIIHSDNGFQYTSNWAQRHYKNNNIIASFSRLGNSIDNAQSKTFFSSLKTEWLVNKHFGTFEELEQVVKEYIFFYNYKRIRVKTQSTPWEAWNSN